MNAAIQQFAHSLGVESMRSCHNNPAVVRCLQRQGHEFVNIEARHPGGRVDRRIPGSVCLWRLWVRGGHHARANIAAGRLVEVLSEAVEGDEEQIHALYLGGPHLPYRVRAFLDFICPRLTAFINGKGAVET